MNDLISRQAAIDAMDECYWSIMGDEPPKLDEKTALYVDLKQAVKRLPTAKPSTAILKVEVSAEEAMETAKNKLSDYFDTLWKTVYDRGKAEAHPRKGKWKHRKNWSMYVCDQCSFENRDASRYCPNCGANMEG